MEKLVAVIDILRVSLITLLSFLISPRKHAARSWLTEFTFRLAKRLVAESVGKPIAWLRTRQSLLKLITPEMSEHDMLDVVDQMINFMKTGLS